MPGFSFLSLPEKVFLLLSYIFAIILNIWLRACNYSFLIYSSLPWVLKIGNCTVCLALWVPENETIHATEERFILVAFVIILFKMSIKHFIVTIRDSYLMNLGIARLENSGFVKCTSERLSLVPNSVIEEKKPVDTTKSITVF